MDYYKWQLEAPACILIAKGKGRKKTYSTEKILQRSDEIFSQPIQDILWCFTENQSVLLKRLKETIPSIGFHKGLPSDDLLENYDTTHHKGIVLDG